jgi:SAM-dependent methyltransferase
MTEATTNYRWNTSAATEAFDAAAEFIHPYYLAIQDLILDHLPFATDVPFMLADLGGGSGRLVERVLAKFPNSRAVVVDQSEPFLALAKRRLTPFGARATVLERRLQENWATSLPAPPQALVSMSAIHHLEPDEKRSLYSRCFEALAPGGVLMNGDEYRPETDDEYLAAMKWWVADKAAAEERGLLPVSFRPMFDAWYDRNVRRFGEPKKSGDDCHETVVAQIGYLRDAGFTQLEHVWGEKLWAVVKARKS